MHTHGFVLQHLPLTCWTYFFKWHFWGVKRRNQNYTYLKATTAIYLLDWYEEIFTHSHIAELPRSNFLMMHQVFVRTKRSAPRKSHRDKTESKYVSRATKGTSIGCATRARSQKRPLGAPDGYRGADYYSKKWAILKRQQWCTSSLCEMILKARPFEDVTQIVRKHAVIMVLKNTVSANSLWYSTDWWWLVPPQ